MKNVLILFFAVLLTLQAVAGPQKAHSKRYYARALRQRQTQRHQRVYHFKAKWANVWPKSTVSR